MRKYHRRVEGKRRILACISIMAILGAAGGRFTTPTHKAVLPAVKLETGKDLLMENTAYLRKWKDSEYSKLDEAAKLELYQKLIDIECAYFGIEPVQVEKEPYRMTEQHGYYSEDGRMISISEEMLQMNQETILETLLHECHHAYAHDLVKLIAADKNIAHPELRLYQDVYELQQGFMDYTNGHEDYAKYRENPVEVAARGYASKRIVDYAAVINSIK